ncbi:efflux RND transporter periplasmic adaptor subunit [Caldovatus aquaticus]|uniref:Efflux RND transporter periplasmic adaptor subunit n=1 Tax=Caldovatus aquaticus TaxID=2865671 RepID=A0ABS7EYU4_9PROT|nr:efflux RND transporter periplasmic adaptor subunit [Caldovatus aquaticus]
MVLAALVLATGAAAVGYLGWQDRAVSRPTQTATATPQPPPGGQPGAFRLSESEVRSLRIAPVALHDFRDERVAEGRIAYNEDRSTPVFSPYSGRVVRLLAAIGQTVAAGTPLFEIETTDLVQASNDLLAAVDAVAKARTTLDLARRNEQRQRELFQARAAARRDWEQAQADAANAAADLRVAETALAAARDRMRVLGRSPEQVAAVEATRRVDAVVAVTAPIGGTVVQRRIGPGQWLTGGAGDPAYVIADLSTMWLVAAVREMDAPLVRVGQEVEVTVNALPDRRFSARITSVGAAIDPNTRRLAVRAEVRDPDGLLKPEMFASFRIVLGEPRESPAVPAGAVIHRGAETGVWVALPDGQSFAYRPVVLGMRSGSLWEVTEGLAAGERIVTGGALFIDRAAQVD